MTALVEAPAPRLSQLLLDQCPLGPWGRPVRRAVDELSKAQDKLAAIRRDIAQRQSALRGLEEVAGSLVLDDFSAADRIGADVAAAQASIRALERAAGVASERIAVAERAVLTAQAAELQDRFKAANAATAKHRARTAELLEVLRQHDIAEYLPIELLRGEITGATIIGTAGTRGSALRHEADVIALQLWAVAETLKTSSVPTWFRPRHGIVGPTQIAAVGHPLPASIAGPAAMFPPHNGQADQDALFRLDQLRGDE